MKKNIVILIYCLMISMISLGQDKQPEKLLREAIYQEEVSGDLEEAINLFKKIVDDKETNRTVMLTALYHLGLSNEKLGNKIAKEYYKQVVSNYDNKLEQVQLAKKRLQILSKQIQSENAANAKTQNQVIARIIYPEPHMTGDITPDGKYLSDVDWTLGNMRINNIATGEKILITDEGTWKKPNKFGDHSVWSHDGKYLAYFWIIGEGAQLRIHNFVTGKYRILAQSTVMDMCPWPFEWTKDGKYILAVGSSQNDQSLGAMQLISVADGSIKNIKALNDCACGGASISPDGKYVAVSQGKEAENRNLHIFSVDGTLDYELINSPGADWTPKWTPDGKKIVFASYLSGNPALWSIEMRDGKKVAEPELIYEGVSDKHFSMRFTDNGKYIYSSNSAYTNIFLTKIKPEEGTIEDPVPLSKDSHGLYSTPFWSPDGNKLAYMVWKPEDWNYGNYIIVHDLKSGIKKELKPGIKNLGQPRVSSWPQWTSDGKSLLLSYATERNHKELVLINIETEKKTFLKGHSWNVFGKSNSLYYVNYDDNQIICQDIVEQEEKVLFESDQQIYHLTISHDKSVLAFFEGEMGTDRTQQKLFVLPLNKAEPQMVWEAAKEQFFTWNAGLHFFPDKKTLLLALTTYNTIESKEKIRQFYTFNIETLEKKKLGPELKNPKSSFEHIRLSPDGKTIAFSAGNQVSNIWSLEFDF